MSFFKLISNDVSSLTNYQCKFNETHDYEKGFAKHYQSQLLPLVQDYDQRRLTALQKARRRFYIACPIAFITFIIGIILLIIGFVKPTLIGAGLIISGLYYWINKSINRYQQSIKDQIIPKILSFYEDCQYSSFCEPRVHFYSNSLITPDFDRETSEDAINVKYKGVTIDLFETKLEEKRKRENSTHWETVFNGIVVHLSLFKKFKGKTIIKRDRGAFINWFNNAFSKLERVGLEDPKFESIFEVYSTNQIEARYLLTTSFMQRLLQLEDFFHNPGLQASFYDDQLLLMIPYNNNLFEPGPIYEPENFIDDAKSILQEMHLLFSIVDTLKLELNIGL